MDETSHQENQMTTPTLPDLFTLNSGVHLSSPSEWLYHRQELLEAILPLEYGSIPPAVPIRAERLNEHILRSPEQPRHAQYRLVAGTEPPVTYVLDLLIPEGNGPRPVVLNGDLCWRYLNDEITRLVLGRGYILAAFNRTEIVPDHNEYGRSIGLYAAFPDLDFAALSAWAWGYHRAVDFLLTLPEVDGEKIVISGHSRGGKAVLLAGATDERIALTNPNNSGCGGAGCYRIQGAGSETLADILRRYGYWFNPRLPAYIGREGELPFDQHFLKAAVAPRLLLTTEALGDLWGNPSGTWHTHQAAREIYRNLGIEQKIGIWYREGGHAHSLADFQALLDFSDWQFFGKPPQEQFDYNPFG
jgi:hypothetical protein